VRQPVRALTALACVPLARAWGTQQKDVMRFTAPPSAPGRRSHSRAASARLDRNVDIAHNPDHDQQAAEVISNPPPACAAGKNTVTRRAGWRPDQEERAGQRDAPQDASQVALGRRSLRHSGDLRAGPFEVLTVVLLLNSTSV